jgi:hypothetical protein
MKRFKFGFVFILGFIIGSLIFAASPIKAAIDEYILYLSEAKIIVDGTEYDNPDLPILDYKGYNYLPAALFREICAKIGVDFQWVGEVNEIQLTTPEIPPEEPQPEPIYTPDGIEATYIEGDWYVFGVSAKWDNERKENPVQEYYILSPIIIKGQAEVNECQLVKVTCAELKYSSRYGKIKYYPIERTLILDHIPLYDFGGVVYLQYDYYVNTILPIVQGTEGG